MNKLFTKIATAIAGFAMVVGVGVAVTNQKASKPVEALSGTLGDKVTPSNFVSNKTVIMVTSDVTKYVKALTTGSNGWLSTNGGTEDNAIEFTLGGAATAASLKTSENKYVGFTGTKNVSLNDSSTAPFYLDASGNVCITSGSNPLKHNDSSKGFRVYTDKDSWKNANLYYVSTGTAATINGNNSVNVGTQWSPESITEDVSGNTVSGGDLTFTFTASNGATISSSNSSTGSFTASSAGTVTISATKTGFEITDKVVTVNSLDPYINLTLASAGTAFTGQEVSVTAEYGNGVAGLAWTITSGSVINPSSSNAGFTATISGDTGTLTIRATDTGSETYSEVSVDVTKVVLTLNKTSTLIIRGQNETLSAEHNADVAGNVTWTSNNAKVTVNAGVVSAAYDADIGSTAIITATSSVDTTVTATCIVTVTLGATLDLTNESSFTTATSELLICEVSNVFEVRVDKNTSTTDANNYYPGKSNTSTRFYKNSKLTITPNENFAAIKAEFKATTNSYANKLNNSSFTNATATVSGDVVTVTFINRIKPVIAVISDTCGFESIKLFYVEKTATQKVESLSTQTSLAYHYVSDTNDDYTYSNICIRFGGKVSKDLWDELDTNEHKITGFGVMIADSGFVATQSDFVEAISDEDFVSSTVSTDLENNIAIDYFVPVANLGTVMGEEGDYYFWNLRQSVDQADIYTAEFSAIAYIKVANEYVLMDIAKESVESLAEDYLINRGYDQSAAADSLQYIVDNAPQA